MKHTLILTIPIGQVYTGIQSDVARLGVPAVWVKPNQLFLELNYLGRIADEQTPQIFKAVSQVVSTTPAFDITLNYLDTLYQRHAPSQIYLSPGKSLELLEFQKNLCLSLRPIDIPQSQKFSPRVVLGTLERADPTTTKYLLDKLIDYELPHPTILSVTTINLLEIFTDKKSIHHQRIATFAMQQSSRDHHPEESLAPASPDTPPA